MPIRIIVERSGSVGRALHWGSKGYLYRSHGRWGHCVVSLSKTLKISCLVLPRKTGNPTDMTEKLLTRM